MGSDVTIASPITSNKIQISTETYSTLGKNSGSRFRQSRVQILALPIASYVTLSKLCKLLNFSCLFRKMQNSYQYLPLSATVRPNNKHVWSAEHSACITCHYQGGSLTPAWQWSQHYPGLHDYCVFNNMCLVGTNTLMHGMMLYRLRFSFFLFACFCLVLVTASRMINYDSCMQ